MQAYRVMQDVPGFEPTVVYCRSAAEARTVAKDLPRVYWPETRVELLEVPTDKGAIVSYLNGGGASIFGAAVLKTWALTDRGALREVPNGE